MGWSPYAAKEFLKAEGFKTSYYSSHDEKEWYASGSQDIEKGSLNTIEYSVGGSREAATKLKLALIAWEEEVPQTHLTRFVTTCSSLYRVAMQAELGDVIEELNDPDQQVTVGNRSISLRKENWKHRAGFELELVIEVVKGEVGA